MRSAQAVAERERQASRCPDETGGMELSGAEPPNAGRDDRRTIVCCLRPASFAHNPNIVD